MSLSRKRKKELRQLQNQANKLWEHQQSLAGDAADVAREAGRQLDTRGPRTDAIDNVHADTLESSSAASKRLVILMAAYLGKARLIDNRVVPLQG